MISINYKHTRANFSNVTSIALFTQLINVCFWKCFMVGGRILVVAGFFQWGYSLDHIGERFLVFCTFIGLMVVVYSGYYIFRSEVSLFTSLIFLFITTMLLLTTSGNIITMFVGWEGVGVLSFVLIGWFISRDNAISASFRAFIYNRFADFFFIVLILWEVGGPSSLFYSQGEREALWSHDNTILALCWIVGLSFWLATAGKSAQFAFHPWLTLAIEGPTPVSSLLHRRTMVVAGVYLLLKLHPLVVSFQWLRLNCVLLSSSRVTLFFVSIWAFRQTDIKKIIALSTTGQLRLMMVTCSIGLYDVAFLHMILHGFFKALLFLGRGVFIHSNRSHSQDLVKINLSPQRTSFLHIVFIFGVMGLAGRSFIGSFHSKHLILDATQYIWSEEYGNREFKLSCLLRSIACLSLFFSPPLTIGYCGKLILYPYRGPSFSIFTAPYIRGNYGDYIVALPLSLLRVITFILGSHIRAAIRGGVRDLSSDDEYINSFYLATVVVRGVYGLLTKLRPAWYLFNYSSFSINYTFLKLRQMIVLLFYLMVEFFILKKGLKSLTPLHFRGIISDKLPREWKYTLKFYTRSILLNLKRSIILLMLPSLFLLII